MTYTTDIPQSGDTLGGTRDRIRTNFEEIATVMAENHVAFNNADEGKHKFLQMPVQASAPATGASEAAFYVQQRVAHGKPAPPRRRVVGPPFQVRIGEA